MKMKRIMVFDTETTNLNKPFCYNLGYVIYDVETKQKMVEKDFVCEQIWHNRELFCTAYYADKRPIYVSRLKGKKAKMDKVGYVFQEIARDIKRYDVESVYAYNSPFDVKVMDFNSEWFKIINPIEILPVYDIRGYVHNKIAYQEEYQEFCETNELFTPSGNYSTTAESVYKFITQNNEFIEEHTALADSRIELEILLYCLELGAKIDNDYKVYRSIKRVEKEKE